MGEGGVGGYSVNDSRLLLKTPLNYILLKNSLHSY